jgi:ribosome-associated protein
MLDTAAKKDTAKLQRAIIDALEDVKAQDIVVFDTEHLSALFERVIIASGTSNRQTKALASSVRDAVREAGFPKPRIEGEDNGEWIIVDCYQCVVHVMQPAIRTYYHLEEIWGDKPVRLKLGAPKPAAPAKPIAPAKPAAKKKAPATGSRSAKLSAKTAAKKAADAKLAPERPVLEKSSASKARPVKTVATKTTATKTSTAKGTLPKTVVAKKAIKPATKTAAAKRPRA